MGLGPLGAPGPRCRIRVVHVTTYCQAGYLLSGKLPTVRQATYSQAKLPTVRQSYLQSSMHPTTAYMHPTEPSKGIDMHPKVSIDLHPTSVYFAPKRSIDMHPKGIDVAPKSSRIHAPKLCVFLKILEVCRMVQDPSKSVPMVFRSPGKP